MWRQVRNHPDYVLWDGNRKRHIVRIDGKNPYALQIDSDGISVYWKEHLAMHRMGSDDLFQAHPQRELIFGANAGDIRSLKPNGRPLHVVYTPQASVPIDCAHACILPSFKEKPEKRLVQEALQGLLGLEHGEPTAIPIPEGA